MRFIGRALIASAFVLGACAGGDKPGSDDTTVATPSTGDTATRTPAPGAPAPITGTTHEVKMLIDGSTYKFEPANLTVKQGDGIKFVMVSGGPHNIAFDPAKIPDDVEAQLSANMPNQQAPLSSPYFNNPNESYTISFGNVKPGTYDYNCTPHVMLGMVGKITVQ